MGKLRCGDEEVVLNKDIIVESGVTNPSDSITIPSQVPICVQNHLKPHTPSTHSLSPPLSPGRPCFIAVWHINEIFPFKLIVRDSYKLERREGRSIFRRIWSFKGGLIEDAWWIHICEDVRRERKEGRSTCDIDVNASASEDNLR